MSSSFAIVDGQPVAAKLAQEIRLRHSRDLWAATHRGFLRDKQADGKVQSCELRRKGASKPSGRVKITATDFHS